MYSNTLNVIQIDEQNFAVRKELLAPKYYQYYPEIKNPEYQLKMQGLDFVLVKAEQIIDDLEELMRPHEMDNYDYPFDGGRNNNYPNKKPYAHQKYTSRWLVSQTGRGAHVHNSMGTGKSLSALWAVDYLIKSGQIKKVLILAPKVVMRSAWLKEITNEMIYLKTCIKQGVARHRVSTAQIDIINHDGITSTLRKFKRQVGKKTYYDFHLCEEHYDLIIYDECTAIKNTQTERWKIFNQWFDYLHQRQGTRIWLLTGTPLAQSPLDAYGLAKVITPETIPTSLAKWRELTMKVAYKISEHVSKWVPTDESVEMCAKALQPSVRFELKDCTDLPEHQFIYVPVEKTATQHKLFEQLAREFIIEVNENKTIFAENAMSKRLKLFQLLSGAVYDEDRTSYEVDASNKLEALLEIVDGLPEDQPVVVFTDFKHVQNYLYNSLTSKGYKTELINGSVSGQGRSDIVTKVLNKEIKIVVCHTKTTALGVDFTSTNVIVYFSPTQSNELYLQSLDRIRRLSSLDKGFTSFLIYHLIADPIEKKVYEGLQDKTMTQDRMLKLMRDGLSEELTW